MRILVRATNWVGDAVMSLPALRELRSHFPRAWISILALPSLTGFYRRERLANDVIEYSAPRGFKGFGERFRIARQLRQANFDLALILPNSFDSALTPWLAGIPKRIGYARDGRRLLLTHPLTPPQKGEIPRHESFYYLELLRRAGFLKSLPASVTIRLDRIDESQAAGQQALQALGLTPPVIGVSPGAAYGNAKRWFPERFAEAAAQVVQNRGGSVAIFGMPIEKELCERVASMLTAQGIAARNLAGSTSMAQFIDMAAACALFLTNDSGSMHIASALGVPTVAVFGATDAIATGPTGDLARIVQRPVDCSPCLLRECPIDHRCMTAVSAREVADTALVLLK